MTCQQRGKIEKQVDYLDFVRVERAYYIYILYTKLSIRDLAETLWHFFKMQEISRSYAKGIFDRCNLLLPLRTVRCFDVHGSASESPHDVSV